MPSRTARLQGFTLMELLIALVLVGILATVAIPSYRVFVERGNRSVAKRVVADLEARNQAVYLRTRAYASDLVPLTGADGNVFFVDRQGTHSATRSSNSIYRIAYCVSDTDTGCDGLTIAGDFPQFQITAVEGQDSDTACLQLTLSQSGQRAATSDSCWDR